MISIFVDIFNYIKAVNNMKYKIDISFIDELVDLINRDNCCIRFAL